MKRTFLLFLILFSISKISIPQNRIEILVNGEVQNAKQTISVANANDSIEIRVYFDDSQKKESLIDSLKTEGCGIKIIQKKKILFFESSSQSQQQESSYRHKMKNTEAVTFKKPVLKAGYYSFEFSVNEITGCRGKFFYLYPIFNSQKSNLNSFANYLNKYKFIYLQ